MAKQEPPQMSKDKLDKRAQALRDNLKKRKMRAQTMKKSQDGQEDDL